MTVRTAVSCHSWKLNRQQQSAINLGEPKRFVNEVGVLGKGLPDVLPNARAACVRRCQTAYASFGHFLRKR